MKKIEIVKEELNLESLKLSQAEMIAHSPEELQKVMDAMYYNMFHMIVKLQQDFTSKLDFVINQVNENLDSEIKKANKDLKVETASVLQELQNKVREIKIQVK